ncbi:MAG: methylmalonyl Co-A mutase-associated GTPase MeaB [Elusimicrobiota bacterium]
MPGSRRARELIEGVVARDLLSVSRALSLVTDEGEGHEALVAGLFRRQGRAHKIGLCGPPGSGKSSLVNRLISGLRKTGERVGVLAVDPSSPYSGGAFLGDRLRFQEHATDEGVFIRSLASRGMMGGLNATIYGAVHVLEATGADRILIETVGTGQDEVDIADVADTVVYVTAPYGGDEFQAMKAGVMEVADLFGVNKADLPDAGKAVAALREALSLGPQERRGWIPKVLGVSALKGQGMEEFLLALDEHRAHLRGGPEGRARSARQVRRELSLLISRRVYRDAVGRIEGRHIEMLLDRETDPVTLGKKLIRGRP